MKKAIVYADRHSSIACGKCDNILKNYIKNNKKDITHIIDLGDEVDNPFMSDFPLFIYQKCCWYTSYTTIILN